MKSKNIIPLLCSLALLASTGLFADDASASGSTTLPSDVSICTSVIVTLDPQNTADEACDLSVASLTDFNITVNPINNDGSFLSIYRIDKTKLVYDKTIFRSTFEDIIYSNKLSDNGYSTYMKTLSVLPLAERLTSDATDITITVPYSSTTATGSTPSTTTKNYKTITLHVTINS